MKRVNKLITAQTVQQETIVHIVSILNFTRYVAHINRKHIKIIIDALDKMVHDVSKPLQHHYLAVYQSELSSTGTSHQICLSKSLGFTILYQNSLHAYHELCGCNKYQNTYSTSYQLLILNRCYHILRRHCHLPCIYQCHLRIPYTFTYVPTF